MCYLLDILPSRVGHEKSGLNLGRPLSKTKHFFTPIAYSTVRERWKVPLEGEWNSSWNLKLTRERESSDDRVPIVEWANELLVVARLRHCVLEP